MLNSKYFKLITISIVTDVCFSIISCDQITSDNSNDNDNVTNLIALLAIQQANTPTPLTSLTYGSSAYLYYRNNAITTNTPTVIGTIQSCASTPNLPAGLVINNSTCALTGTPTTVQGSTSYTVTATNSLSNKSTSLAIRVKDFTLVSALCGDGEIDTFFGETCDDGNTTNSDGCSNTCRIE